MGLRRTDLALEANDEYMKSKSPDGKLDGIEVTEENDGKITVTTVKIQTDDAGKRLGKVRGKYVTIHSAGIRYDSEVFEKTCHHIADTIRSLIDFSDGDKALVVGLGNRDITPDALGDESVSHIMVTSHIKELRPDIFDSNIRAVCAIAPGVMGTTGIESADIIKSVCSKIKPKIVIVIDALCAIDLGRICTTFQISDVGIAPGAGVGNNRRELSEKTLGAKVISIGVPTVIDLGSITNADGAADMVVTPRDIDDVIKKSGDAIAMGINLALHRNLSISDIREYAG